jgi:phage FluMu protein Com
MRIRCKNCGNGLLRIRFDPPIGWLTIECCKCGWQRTFVNFETINASKSPAALNRLDRLKSRIERRFGVPQGSVA